MFMTPHLDSHSTTDPKPEILWAVYTGKRISRDGKNACSITYAHVCRKDDISKQRRLSIHHVLCIVYYASCIIHHASCIMHHAWGRPQKQRGMHAHCWKVHNAGQILLCGIFTNSGSLGQVQERLTWIFFSLSQPPALVPSLLQRSTWQWPPRLVTSFPCNCQGCHCSFAPCQASKPDPAT